MAETFTTHVSAINGENDDYVHTSKTSSMELADIYPAHISFEWMTDQDSHNNGMEIFDDNGEVFFYIDDLKPDSLYRFDLEFKAGCYEMIFYDLDGNGLEAQNSYFLKIIDSKKNQEIKSFHSNFGAEIREQFMILK